MIPRWCHRMYARWAGYFWLPCKICDRPFGGHEMFGSCYSCTIAGDDGGLHSWAMCPKCSEEFGRHLQPGEYDDARAEAKIRRG